MARTKITSSDTRRTTRRTTWTRFRLPLFRRWPKWRDQAALDAMPYSLDAWDVHDMSLKSFYHGPLADVHGVMRVRVGRMVENQEQAVFIIVWESAERLQAFQDSTRCAIFLRGLGLPEDGSSSPFAVTLRHSSGFNIGKLETDEDGLHGRITLTILDIPFSEIKEEDRDRWYSPVFRPLSSTFWPRNFDPSAIGPRFVQWNCHTLVTKDGGPDQGPTGLCYSFRRWNAYGLTNGHQLEEASVREPEWQEWWTRKISEMFPPVKCWRQERWDIDLAPCCRALCGLDDLEFRYEDEDE